MHLRRLPSWRLLDRMTAEDHVYTLGIEEEFAIIDPETRELRSHIQEILEVARVTLKEQIKPKCTNRWSNLARKFVNPCRCARNSSDFAVNSRSLGLERFEDCIGRTHPFSTLARSAHHRRRALSGNRQDMHCWPRANLSSDCTCMSVSGS